MLARARPAGVRGRRGRSTPEGRQRLLSGFGQPATLDILVNNVGTNVKKPSQNYSKGDYDKVFGTNLESAVALTAMLHPLLKRGAEEAAAKKEEKEGEKAGDAAAPETSSIVLISSVAGGPPSMKSGSLYAATKAALDQLARNWACEWARDGIRVTAVKPFYIDTPLASGVVGDPRQLQQVLDATPSRRVGSPEDVAGVVAFLCSRAAAHVTGETVAVDGGYLAAGFWPVRLVRWRKGKRKNEQNKKYVSSSTTERERESRSLSRFVSLSFLLFVCIISQSLSTHLTINCNLKKKRNNSQLNTPSKKKKQNFLFFFLRSLE